MAMSHAPEDLTEMLKQWGGGDRDALDRIMPIIYDELRRIARRNFRRERADNIHQPTAFDSQQSRIVELKFFGGLSIEETAEVMGISAATVKREWALARTWLFRELSK